MPEEEKEDDDTGTSLRDDLEEALNPTDEEKDTDDVEESSTEGSEQTSETDEDNEDEKSSESSESEEDKTGEESEEVTLEAPDQWSDEDKELFNGQSDDVKSYLLGRTKQMEDDYRIKTTTLAEQRKENEALNQFAEKWTPHVAPLGVPLVNALDQLLQNDAQLRNGTPEQKIAVATQLLKSYGVDISALVPVPATTTTEQDDAYADPALKAIQDQITQITGTLTERDLQDQQALDQQQATIATQAQSAFETFKTATDESGNPKYPHLEAVRSQMGILVANGQAGTGDIHSQLESAYDSALWMNSDTREQLLKDRQSSTKTEEIEKQKKAAAQAKKSAKANKTGTKANTEQPKNLSLREDLALQIEQANA